MTKKQKQKMQDRKRKLSSFVRVGPETECANYGAQLCAA